MTTTTAPSSEVIYSPFGRISRKTYWLRTISLLGAIVGLVVWGQGSVVLGFILMACLLLLPLQWMKRARDAGWGAWIALLILIPTVNVIMMVLLGTRPTRSASSDIKPTVENEATPTERARDMDKLIQQMKSSEWRRH